MNVKNLRKKLGSRRKTRKVGARLSSVAPRMGAIVRPLLPRVVAPALGQMAFQQDLRP